MRRVAVPVLAGLCACAFTWPLPGRAAAAADPLQAPACLKARQALAAYEVEAGPAAAPDRAQRSEPAGSPAGRAPEAAAAPAIPPRLRALRQAVARDCLATTLDAPRPPRQVQPPVAVPPVGSTLPPRQPPVATTPRANPGPVAQPPLRSITSCDSGGCWTSDGTRLQRMGPSLVGPQGACNVSGNVVSCP
jgi:hypothetical protein